MNFECDRFLEELDQKIQSKHLLKHDFYLAWSKGELSSECLCEYAKEYYHHVQAFPTYLSAIHSRTKCQKVRRSLLQNLIEEEAGSPNHPELWKQFALALGVDEEELASHAPNREIKHLIEVFRAICSHGSTVEGLAALYAYESQIPEICLSKINGLKMHYDMQDPKHWEYFRVHIAADQEHAAEEKKLLKTHVDLSYRELALLAADRVLDALWNFLSGLCQRYQILECGQNNRPNS